MKLNISYPATGLQKLIEIEDEKKIRPFYEKRMSTVVDADSLGDEWKGYKFRIAGGNDKQGFAMKQGILTTGRVRLLLKAGMKCYKARRKGERKRKSVRGCIVDANLSVLALVIVQKGDNEIPGLTDRTLPRRYGPKRASKIRKLFNLSKDDDVRKYVIRTKIPLKEGQTRQKYKTPKIQRLITPIVRRHRRRLINIKKSRVTKRREEASEYAQLLAAKVKETKIKRMERRRSFSQRLSESKGKKQKKGDKGKAKKDAAAEGKPLSKTKQRKVDRKNAMDAKRLKARAKARAKAKEAAEAAAA